MHEWEMIEFQHINSTFFLGNMSVVAITMALWSAHGEAAHLASANAVNSLFLVFAPMIQKIRHRNLVFTGKSWRWSAPWGRRRSTRSQGAKTLMYGIFRLVPQKNRLLHQHTLSEFAQLRICRLLKLGRRTSGRHCVMFSNKWLRI